MGGRQPIMQTIMAGKMEMVLPAMYMMNRFMGICFSGPLPRTFSMRILSLSCTPPSPSCRSANPSGPRPSAAPRGLRTAGRLSGGARRAGPHRALTEPSPSPPSPPALTEPPELPPGPATT
uniref:Uncharacterized protein n=1 Tax=Taeniopygia guttata TaxID=59729 RepID=A0A674H4V7_TAEGU